MDPFSNPLDDFLSKAASVDLESTAQEYSSEYEWSTGDMVKFMISEIRPRKKEYDAYKLMFPDDPDCLNIYENVPWDEGISLTLIPLKVKTRSGNVLDLIQQEGDLFKFPCGVSYKRRQYTGVRPNDINGGFLRVYDAENRFSKVKWPSDWNDMMAAMKFAYWLQWVGGKHGIPRHDVAPGTAFYAYVKTVPDKYLVDVSHSTNIDGSWVQVRQAIQKIPDWKKYQLAFESAVDFESSKYKQRQSQQGSVPGVPF